MIFAVAVAGIAMSGYSHDKQNGGAGASPNSRTASEESLPQASPTAAIAESNNVPQAKKHDMFNDPEHPIWGCKVAKVERLPITLSSWSPRIFVKNTSDYEAHGISIVWQAFDATGVLTQQAAFLFDSIPAHTTASANGGLLLEGDMTLKVGWPSPSSDPSRDTLYTYRCGPASCIDITDYH
jgi:hypothetical protein